MNSRTLKGFYWDGDQDIPDAPHTPKTAVLNQETKTNYRILRGSFTAIVYVVADNTMHLLIMYYGYKFLFGA